jgi:hypothetical protein
MPKNELERVRRHRGRRLASLEHRVVRLERLAAELEQLSDELRYAAAPRRRSPADADSLCSYLDRSSIPSLS